MRSFRLRIAVIAAVSGSVVMCREPTRVPAPPSLAEIMAHRAVWDSYHISDYSYVYQFDGAFNVLANQPIRIQVRADTVRAAMLTATGDTLTDLRDLPTINSLFDRAVAAVESHELTAITFDAGLGYPTRLSFPPRPDMTQQILATVIVTPCPGPGGPCVMPVR